MTHGQEVGQAGGGLEAVNLREVEDLGGAECGGGEGGLQPPVEAGHVGPGEVGENETHGVDVVREPVLDEV